MAAFFEIIPELAIFLICLLCLSILLALRAWIQAIQIVVKKIVSGIPFLGDVLGDAFGSVASPITQLLDQQISKLDKAVGWSWHLMARTVTWTYDLLLDTPHLVNQLAHALYQFGSKDYISALYRELRAAVRAATHAGGVALHETVVINRKADRALVRDVLPRLKALEHETAHVLEPELAGLRHAERGLTRDLTALERYVRAAPWTVVSEAFVGAVAVALAKLGLDWLRCSNAKSLFRNNGCAPWKLLADALGFVAAFALAAFGVLNPDVLARATVSVVDNVEPLLDQIVSATTDPRQIESDVTTLLAVLGL